MRVLLLCVDIGLGSRSLARSLAHALGAMGAAPQIVSVHDLLPPWLDHALFGRYRQWCMEGGGAFDAIYRMQGFYPALYRVLPSLVRWRGNERRDHAHAVFSDYRLVIACSFYCGFFAHWYAKQFKLNLKIVGVLGDYAMSPGWRLPLDMMFVSHDAANATLRWHERRGAPVLALGIPTSPGRIDALGEPGHVLVTGGGWGLTPGFDPIATLMDMPDIHRVTVACGMNKTLARSLRSQYAPQIEAGRLVALGAVDGLAPHYARAQIVVTKAGGLTLTEAAIARRPIVATGALPGHEQANLEVFKRNHALWHAGTPEALRRCIATLLTRPEIAECRTTQAARLTNARAAHHITQEILSALG